MSSTSFVFTGTKPVPKAQLNALVTDLINAQERYTIIREGELSPELELLLDNFSDTTEPPVDQRVVVVAEENPEELKIVQEAWEKNDPVLDLTDWLIEIYPNDEVYQCQ